MPPWVHRWFIDRLSVWLGMSFNRHRLCAYCDTHTNSNDQRLFRCVPKMPLGPMPIERNVQYIARLLYVNDRIANVGSCCGSRFMICR